MNGYTYQQLGEILGWKDTGFYRVPDIDFNIYGNSSADILGRFWGKIGNIYWFTFC